MYAVWHQTADVLPAGNMFCLWNAVVLLLLLLLHGLEFLKLLLGAHLHVLIVLHARLEVAQRIPAG
jgi:hypothetical protein